LRRVCHHSFQHDENAYILSFYALVGFDLSSAYDVIILKGGKGIVKTDLAIAIPENTYARIGERSCVATKLSSALGFDLLLPLVTKLLEAGWQ
jgi:dUTPase